MRNECGQITENFIRELRAKRRRLVDAQEENDVNLDALVDFLYPDTAHLVFELLQNAEDAGATSTRFDLSADKLSFTHDGRPFSRQDLKNITNYFRSAKYEQEDKIGRFGIGFKSVFACTETPRIRSGAAAFEIVDRIVPRPILQPAALPRSQTVIELPFDGKMKTVEEVREELRLGLERLPAMSVLHLENIESIEWRTGRRVSGSLRRGAPEGGLVRVDIARETDDFSVTRSTDGVARVEAASQSREKTRWFLRFREPHAQGSKQHLDVVFELRRREPKQAAREALPMDDEDPGHQFHIVPSERGRVAVFFDAAKETSNLRFHLHAPFIPELSRASIKDHPDNAALIGRLAELVARSLPAIRDLGLLVREFLGVLPNSKDAIRDEYRPFHEAVVQAMREEPLVPMRGGGHGKATRLLRGPARDMDFLGMDDCRFLMSGRDRKNGYTWMDRSATPEPDYDGWAVSATQRNNKVDRFLADLEMDEFKVEYVVPPESRTDEEIAEWLGTHDAPWCRAWYASLEGHLAGRTLRRLQQLPVVRTRSGEYRPAAECRFATDEEAAEGVAIVDPDTYSLDGAIDDVVKGVLQQFGVRELDDESKLKGILEKYYGQPGRQPEWEEHKRHVERFIDFVQREQDDLAEVESRFRAGSSRLWADRRKSQMRLKATRKALAGSRFLLSRDGQWLQPDQLYAGGDSPNSPASYYRCRARLPRVGHYHMRPSRRELDSRYRAIPRFDEFARTVGVVYEIPVRQAKCERNPEFRHLESGGGSQWTHRGTDRDWKAPYRLGNVLEWLEQGTADLEPERENLARAIHAALDETRNDTWPPPDPCRWEDGDVSGKLVAVYRRNTAAAFRTAPSQFVFTLRRHAWVPQKEKSGGRVFVKPGEARRERLPEGFAFDPGWAWVKAVEFGQVPREEEPAVEQEGRGAEEMAKALGFRDLDAAERAKRFADLPEEDQEEFWAWREAKNQTPEFPEPRNPARRSKKARQEAREAPARGTERRQRSVAAGEDELKAEARTKLRAWYEEFARSSLCQVSDCKGRSFRLRDGNWYFEAVRFLRLSRMIAADYVALCPRHAAMFQHANESRNDLKRTFEEICTSGNGAGEVKIPLVLAGQTVEILLAPNHVIDLKAALDVERSSG